MSGAVEQFNASDTGRVLMYSKHKRTGVCFADPVSDAHRCRVCGAHTLSSYEPDRGMWRRRCMSESKCQETWAKTFEEL